MRGVAALGGLLRRHPGTDLDLLMVWERVERKAIAAPPPAVTEKIADARTKQFWDPDQLLGRALLAAAAADPAWPGGRLPEEEGVIWDSVLFFPAGARWDDRPPRPQWAGGDIIDVIDELERRLFREPHSFAIEARGAPSLTSARANLP